MMCTSPCQRVVSMFALLTLAGGAGCQSGADVARLPDPAAAKANAATHPTDAPQADAAAEAPPAPAASPAQATPPDGGRTVLPVLSGSTEAYRSSTIAPQVGGKVTEVLVREGREVKPGEPLLILDRTDFRLRIAQAEAARAMAMAQLDATRIEWDRVETLIKEKAVAQSQFDKLDAQLKVSQAALAQANVTLQMARRDLENAVVRAPFTGLVTAVHIEVGEYATTVPPARLVTLEQIDRLQLRIQVPETMVALVQPGMSVRARFAALEQTIQAPITRVVRSIDPQRRSFPVLVDLDNADRSLRPGMFAEVTFVSDPERAR